MAIVHVAMHDAVNADHGGVRAVQPDRCGARRRARRKQLRSPPRTARSSESSATRRSSREPTRRRSARTASHQATPASRSVSRSPMASWNCARTMARRSPPIRISRRTPARSACGHRSAPRPRRRPCCPDGASVTPWVLRSGSQFRPGPPPALDSERYARDYNEILQIGALDQLGAHRRTDRRSRCSGGRRRPRCGIRSCGQAVETAQPGSLGDGASDGALLSRGGRCERRVLGCEVRLQLLAAAAGDRARRRGRQRRDVGRSGLAAAGSDAAAPGIRVRTHREQRRDGVRAGADIRRRAGVRHRGDELDQTRASCATGPPSAKAWRKSSTPGSIRASTSAPPTRSAPGWAGRWRGSS